MKVCVHAAHEKSRFRKEVVSCLRPDLFSREKITLCVYAQTGFCPRRKNNNIKTVFSNGALLPPKKEARMVRKSMIETLYVSFDRLQPGCTECRKATCLVPMRVDALYFTLPYNQEGEVVSVMMGCQMVMAGIAAVPFEAIKRARGRVLLKEPLDVQPGMIMSVKIRITSPQDGLIACYGVQEEPEGSE